jgi:hypothetical protein
VDPLLEAGGTPAVPVVGLMLGAQALAWAMSTAKRDSSFYQTKQPSSPKKNAVKNQRLFTALTRSNYSRFTIHDSRFTSFHFSLLTCHCS